MSALGFGLAAASAVFNGSFCVPAKLRPTDPVVFILYFSVGMLMSSLVAPAFYSLSGNTFGITGWGLLSGLLVVVANMCSFFAIRRVGLAIGQGVWSGGAIVVSFLWGAVGPEEVTGPLRSVTLSVVALALLMVGIAAMIVAERFSTATNGPASPGAATAGGAKRVYEGGFGDDRDKVVLSPLSTSPLSEKLLGDADADIESDGTSFATAVSGDGSRASSAAVPAAEADAASPPPTDGRRPPGQFASGMMFAATVGVTGGSVLVPLYFAPSELQGIGFLPSVGLGSALSALVIVCVHLGTHPEAVPSAVEVRRTAGAGVLAGATWNAGNYCQIIAVGSAGGLSLGVAYPMLQCALFVSGLWGIFYFQEMSGAKAIVGFFSGGSVLLGGAVLLGLNGPQH